MMLSEMSLPDFGNLSISYEDIRLAMQHMREIYENSRNAVKT